MNKFASIALLVPLVVSALLFAGCESDDESPSGTATVTGNVRQFYTDTAITTAARAKAAAGVTIELRTVDGSYTALATSEADGTFRFENVPSGDFELILTGGGTTGKIIFTVPDGATVKLTDIVVKKDGTIYEGEIVEKEPEPETVATTTEAPAPTPAPAPKVQWIDQQQTTGQGSQGSYRRVYSDLSGAQSFKVGATNGSLFEVEFTAVKVGAPSADLRVSIRATPDGVNLASTTLKPANIPTSYDWVSAIFAAPPALAANSTYWVAFESTTPTAAGEYRVELSPWHHLGTFYAGGIHQYKSGALPWSSTESGYDQVFKVWLEK